VIDLARFMEAAKDLVGEALKQHRAREHTYLRTGKVMSVDATNFRCNVRIAGDTTDTTRLSYNKDLTLAVNDYVVIAIQNSRPYVVLCKTNAVL
jgi:hypothetical protein